MLRRRRREGIIGNGNFAFMEITGKNDILFELIQSGKIRIRDCGVNRFNIFLENWELCIEIDFKYFDIDPFRIRFSGIEEYGF